MQFKFLFVFFLFYSFLGHTLTLDEYLKQVEENNLGIKGADLSVQAKRARDPEALLIFSPSLFVNSQFINDELPTNAPSFQGRQTLRQLNEVGITEKFATGTSVTLSYFVNHTEIKGASPTFLPNNSFYDMAPQITFSQSLWKNFAGKEDRNLVVTQKAQIQMQGLQDILRKKQLMVKAQNTFYRVGLVQSALKVQKESFERAKKLRDLNAKRVAQKLSDEADLLQAEANLQMRDMELKNTQTDLDSALLEFNSLRESSEEIQNIELKIDDEMWISQNVPEKKGQREDVLLALTQHRLTSAQAEMGKERNKPDLKVFGTYSRNGRSRMYDDALSDSWGSTHPYMAVGLRFSTPLNFSGLTEFKKSYENEKIASELGYKRKIFEADREWEDLVQRFNDFKKRYSLSLGMEKIQKEKLASGKDLYNRARTTIFQVLQFEQDFANTQLLKIRNLQELIAVYHQLEFYTGDTYAE